MPKLSAGPGALGDFKQRLASCDSKPRLEAFSNGLLDGLFEVISRQTEFDKNDPAFQATVTAMRRQLDRALGKLCQFGAFGGDGHGEFAEKCPSSHIRNVLANREETWKFFNSLRNGGQVLIGDPFTHRTLCFDVASAHYSHREALGTLHVSDETGNVTQYLVPQSAPLWMMPRNSKFRFFSNIDTLDINDEDPNEDDLDALEEYLTPKSSHDVFFAKSVITDEAVICKFIEIDREQKCVVAKEVGAKGGKQSKFPIKHYHFGHLTEE